VNPAKVILLYRHLPPPTEGGATVADLCAALGEPARNVQRNLVAFERAGLARRDPSARRLRARWWRSGVL
jgi:DNA-binding IclR family transcriptional regulator